MPLPERYAVSVPDIDRIWEPEGYFDAQMRIWGAQSEARHERDGLPTASQLEEILAALSLTPEEIEHLINAKGHETNTLLRLVQGKLSTEAGNYVHKGNTSSDVLDTSTALQMRESLSIVRDDFSELQDSLRSLALEHRDTLQIARTHGQHAIPHTFGRQVLGWYAEVGRGIGRIDHSAEVIAFGKCSWEVGTNVFIDPDLEERALEKLGLKPDEAPTQIISRDRHAEVMGLMAVNAATLTRITMNVRLLAMTDLGEVREPFEEGKQGSSAMPHKRNPDISERVAGVGRIVKGTAAAELDAVVSLLERDISHSSTERFTFPDAFGGLAYAARLTKDVIDGLVVNKSTMLENINKTHGAIYSPRVLNALLDSGQISRTEGYDLVKKLAQQAMDERTPLKSLIIGNEKIIATLGMQEINGLFDPSFYLKNIDVAYRRLGLLPAQE